jgi:protein-disulfide isomerase
MKANKLFVTGIAVATLIAFGILVFFNKPSTETKSAPVANADQLLVKPHSPVKGNPDAKVTIVEFLDPECEACRSMHPIVKRLLSEYEGQVKLVIRYMPLHGNSKFAASALEEAREQGKFEEALDVLFDRQPEWGGHHQPRPEMIAPILKEIGITGDLDQATLIAKHGAKIDMDQADGTQLGVRLTPTFFVNGVQLPEIGYGPVKQAIDIALSK